MDKKQLSIYKLIENSGYQPIITDDGQIIVPVVMMVEGVHNGTQGPLFYSTASLEETVKSWEGMPVTIYHPQDARGAYVSASGFPSVGEVRNARMEGSKLKADAYLSYAQLQTLSQETLDRINANAPLEVSVGLFSMMSPEPGDWNGESYDAVIQNARPDHLALLPNETGACSIDDGCGLRVNSNNFKLKQDGGLKNQMDKKKDLSNVIIGIVGNETGFREISRSIQDSLDILDNGQKSHYLEEVYDDYFVYQVSSQNPQTRGYMKQGYSLSSSGEVSYTEGPIAVKRSVTFDVLTSGEEENVIKFKRKEKTVMNRKGKATSCSIDAVIGNEGNAFSEEDREFLANQSQEFVDSFKEKEVTIVEKVVPVANAAVVAPDMQKEIATFFAANPEAVMNHLPADVRDNIRDSQELYATQKADLIDEIVANSTFTKEQLAVWKVKDLEVLLDNVQPEETADYTIRGINRMSASDKDEEVGEDLIAMTRTEVPAKNEAVA